MNYHNWIHTFRLRTLFLSLSCIGGGLICAKIDGYNNPVAAFFTLITCLFLQILSNIANDYGDSIHGADHSGRKGPQRSVQSGVISSNQMKKGIIIGSILSLTSGLLLLYYSIETIGMFGAGILFIFGLLCIVAAIAYTNGSRPYGYMGLGDLAVFIFFGLIGVMGTYYLQTGYSSLICIIPAAAYGFLSVGVLNLNNMRDIESDQTAGKNSIPVRLGRGKAKIYHYLLLLGAAICFTVYTFKVELNWLFLLPVYSLIYLNLKAVFEVNKPEGFDPLLKLLSLSTFIITILFYFTLFI